MTAFLTSLAFIVLAEMGDKTQLLAMCLAMRYRWQTVMWGVFAATAVNHFLAVLAGNFLTAIIPMNIIHIAAAVSFVIFGLWTIRGDTAECENKQTTMHPFWIVAIAFFIAECGDKTQLATVALSAQYNSMISVWIGTTAGMLIADAIGIISGVIMGRRIPAQTVKWFAALVFIAFGVLGLYRYLPEDILTAPVVTGGMVLLVVLIILSAKTGKRNISDKMRQQ